MPDNELKPCPFCGGDVERKESHVKDEGPWIAHKPRKGGNNCGLEFSSFNIDGDVSISWNTRPIPDAGKMGGDALESFLDDLRRDEATFSDDGGSDDVSGHFIINAELRRQIIAAIHGDETKPLKATGEDVERVAKLLDPSAWECFTNVKSGEYRAAAGYDDILRRVAKTKEQAAKVIASLRPPVGVADTQGVDEAALLKATTLIYKRGSGLMASKNVAYQVRDIFRATPTNPAPCIKSDGEVERLREALGGMVALWNKYYQHLPVKTFPDVEDEEFGPVNRARQALSHPSNAMKESE